jgi:integrase
MPTNNENDRRDQALFALVLLTGMRDAAAVSLKVKHISIERRRIFQDAREVRTKFAKAIETFFFPVGENVAAIVCDWVSYLTLEQLFGPDDPLFPKTAVGHDEHLSFTAQGLTREHWANASPVRQIFRTAFERIGLPYVKPHTVRDTLTQFAYRLQLNPQWICVQDHPVASFWEKFGKYLFCITIVIEFIGVPNRIRTGVAAVKESHMGRRWTYADSIPY